MLALGGAEAGMRSAVAGESLDPVVPSGSCSSRMNGVGGFSDAYRLSACFAMNDFQYAQSILEGSGTSPTYGLAAGAVTPLIVTLGRLVCLATPWAPAASARSTSSLEVARILPLAVLIPLTATAAAATAATKPIPRRTLIDCLPEKVARRRASRGFSRDPRDTASVLGRNRPGS